MKSVTANIFSVLIISLMVIYGPEPGTADDIGTNFFLKASKSVPRIGRRSMDFDNHFLKASKSVPRIGRRGSMNDLGQMRDMKGFPIIRNTGPEVYMAETGQPLWGDVEKSYETFPRMQSMKFRDEYDGNDAFWTRIKKESELEEPRIQAEIY